MANTRNFTGLGVWAEDAVTPVPVTPTQGTAYRDETVTESQNKAGEPFKTKPDSAVFNQKMFSVTSFIEMLNTHGGIGWSDQVDYAVPAVVWASDSLFYFALQSSGPSTNVKDPISEPTYWEPYSSAFKLRQELAVQTNPNEGDRIVGHTGETVYDALNTLQGQAGNLQGLQVLAAGSFDSSGVPLSGTITFNIDSPVSFLPNSDFIYVVPFTNAIQATKAVAFVTALGIAPDTPPFDLGNPLVANAALEGIATDVLVQIKKVVDNPGEAVAASFSIIVYAINPV